jgi:translation initiation factor 1
MAKRRKASKEIAAAPRVTNNPFGALAGLREALPAAPELERASAGDTPDAVRSKPGSKVVVRRETKGRGGKTVTRVSGLAGELGPFATRMKKALGCGASVEGDELILLGSLVERAATWLEAQGLKRIVRAN